MKLNMESMTNKENKRISRYKSKTHRGITIFI